MPKRVPVNTIIVHRDGKALQAPLGEAFDFTAEEVEDIQRMNPSAFRKVVIEDGQLEAEFKADEKAEEKAVAKNEKVATAAAKSSKTSAADL